MNIHFSWNVAYGKINENLENIMPPFAVWSNGTLQNESQWLSYCKKHVKKGQMWQSVFISIIVPKYQRLAEACTESYSVTTQRSIREAAKKCMEVWISLEQTKMDRC